MNKIPQELMRREAEAQARDRHNRTGERCEVWRIGETWYVRTVAEGKPAGGTLEYYYPHASKTYAEVRAEIGAICHD